VVKQYSVFAAIVGLLLTMISLPALSAPFASIDRSVIAVDDSFTLTIRIDRAGTLNGPDLQALETDFHVLGNSQSSRHMIRNGQSESWTEWLITLMPKRKGELTIPSLTVDGERTQPLEISVQASIPHSGDYPEPVYLESEVDQSTVYVQQQILFTLRIFQSIQLDDMNISEPEFDNAAMEKLRQKSFQRRINNAPYRVHELRYAIFPQQTGELIIPELVFTASEAVARRSVFNLPGQGKPIRKMTKQHSISVIPAAAAYTGQLWLPAKSLKLSANWNGDPNNIRVGDSITRTITLQADGLLDSQLPPFEFANISGAKIYPDQGSTETTVTDGGVVASRVDSAAIIPTRSGVIELPEVSYSWWNTETQQQQQAMIPASRLTVLPALQSNQSSSTPLAIDHSPVSTATDNKVTVATATHSTLWPAIAALMAAGWMVTLYLWWRTRRKLLQSTQPVAATTVSAPSEKQAYKQLAKACKQQQAKDIRLALIDWARCYWQTDTLHNLQDIQHCCDHAGLQQQLAELDRLLFSQQPAQQLEHADDLLAAVEQLRSHRETPEQAPSSLPGLYAN
jgi:hypothetical protein